MSSISREDMAANARLFIFGDQTGPVVPKLRELLAAKDDPILAAFLDQSHYVLRAQMIQSLPRHEHKAQRTANLASMVQRYADGDLSPAFQTALSCLCELGLFMRELQPQDKSYPRSDDSLVLGLCTGSLAAAAVSSSSSLSELLPLAVQTVLISFRLGQTTVTMRNKIESSSDHRSGSWAASVVGMDSATATSAIEEFCRIKKLSVSRKPWFASLGERSVTVAAPPLVLEDLLAEPAFAQLKPRKIAIRVPGHNASVYTPQDIEEILETTNEATWSGYPVKLPMVSASSGTLSWASDFRAQMENALAQCLLEPLNFTHIEQKLPRLLRSRGFTKVSIIPIQTSADSAIAKALSASIGEVKIMQPSGANECSSHRPGNGKDQIAIVSMSGRFPESPTTDHFWKLLYEGLDVVKEVPKRRWDVTTHVDPDGKARNKGATKWGCWLDFAGDFDPRFFSISPKEAPQMDPAQRMALMTTYEAMERGGIVPDTTPSTQRDRIGVFHGVTSNDWMETNTAQNIDTYFITGGNRGFIPGRINFCFEFSGPSYTNDTACSSSLAAIHLACNSLWRGDCDTAVAGGTNMIFTPDGHAGLDKGFFLSRTGNCKAFDDNADGYCRAEGVGTIFLKRLEDALADGDPILGTILGAKTNHSAMSDSMTRPHTPAQIENMTAVLNMAGVDSSTISYVEMHGTGTQVGDAVEMESVLSTFAPREGHRHRDAPLYVGSAKANIGHGEGVSGITSLIKILLMMQNDTIPPHCGIKPGSRINHNFPDLPARNVHIAFEPTPWPRAVDRPRRVLINNFSAAGGNTALLIEDAPKRQAWSGADSRTSHVVTVSGHVAKAVQKNMSNLHTYIQLHKNIPLNQLSYTTTARRWHHLHRVALVGSTTGEIISKLEAAIANGGGTTRPKVKPRLLFAFTGQGSQYLGMGKALMDSYPKFRNNIRSLSRLAQSLGFPDILSIFATNEGDIETWLPVSVQLAVTCLQMALFDLLSSFGVSANAVIGHSLGEYAALYAAGVLTASDCIHLVGNRAKLLQERCQRGTHAMLAVQASVATLDHLAVTNNGVNFACMNGPEAVVLSGPISAVLNVQKHITADGHRSTLLKLPFAFHSAQVDPVLEEFKQLAVGATFDQPKLAVLSPSLGRVVRDFGTFGPSYLADHCRKPVNFTGVLQEAKSQGVIDLRTICIEIGPRPLLCNMLKDNLGQETTALPTLDQSGGTWRNLTNILATLYAGGIDPNWTAVHEPFTSAKTVLQLPSYAWDLKDYFIPYEGDWVLHRHKIHCNCADPWCEAHTTSEYVPGKHTFTSNVIVPNGITTSPLETKKSKLNPTKEAFPGITATTTLHRVVEENTEPLGATLTVETDISRSDVHAIAKGHTVDGIPLCTPSFYADIAMQVGKYAMDRLRAGHKEAINGNVDVCNMIIDKALIPHGLAPQPLRTTITMSWPPKAAATTRSADVKFSTYTADGKIDTEHATCTVRFVTDAQKMSLQKRVPEYKLAIAGLQRRYHNGQLVHYNTKSGYKLMNSMAQFHPDYKLLEFIILDEAVNEAMATVDFAKCANTGSYHLHPAYIDAITQVGGFAMNAKDDTDITNEVYVNHGWESLQVYHPLEKGRSYVVYTKMTREKQGDLVHGDTVVLDGDSVVAFFKNLSLRCVPRKALQMVLQLAMDKGARQRGDKVKSLPKTSSTINADFSKKTHLVVKPAVKPAATMVLPTVPTADPATPSKTWASPGVSASNVVDTALDIISQESGISRVELTGDSSFVEIGVDSLSSMVITSRMREELGLNLDPSFVLFVDCPTVGDLQDFLQGTSGRLSDIPVASMPDTTAALSPPPSDHTEERDSITVDHSPRVGILHAHAGPVEEALQIISEESGIALEEYNGDTNFADVGIDSLCSMAIGSRFREELGLDLDTGFSLFTDLPTVGELVTFLGGKNLPVVENKNSKFEDPEFDRLRGESNGSSTGSGTTDYSIGEPLTPKSKQPGPSLNLVDECRSTTSVILQGLPKVAKKLLFMLPDGGGSASSYATIPRLTSDVALIGLNCPYAREPELMNCTHTAMIRSFVDEIKRRQSRGPYHLGGWSSGGAFAYVTAEALVDQGDEVHSLIIIDAPVPQVMEKLPVEFYEHCNSIGLFVNQPGGAAASEPPPYLIPHFMAVVDVMLDYEVAPLKTSRMPNVGIIWASETVMDESNAPAVKGMHFMLQKRQRFDPDGWETLCPGAAFDVVKADGANHFTLMTGKYVRKVSDLIDRVMG